MTESLNVVALISGGKDSFFSLHHCIANGHRVIALANLQPPSKLQSTTATANGNHSESAKDEGTSDSLVTDLQSYMYQTAGHNLIPFYGEALELPLYLHSITGEAVDASKYYDSHMAVSDSRSKGDHGLDETESLLTLLRTVVAAHPEVNAVCSGAILSSYQRTRIESVAVRLELVPLSYLWQYPLLPPSSQEGLLDDMTALGFDARIVKVASGGLDKGLLWSNLMELCIRSKVRRAMNRFGGSVLGEGGEYETVVIDGPPTIWKRRLVVQAEDFQPHIETDSDGTALLTFNSQNFRTVKKEACEACDDLQLSRQISLWDPNFEKLLKILPFIIDQCATTHGPSDDETSWDGEPMWNIRPQVQIVGSLLYLSNICEAVQGGSVSEEMELICKHVVELLQGYGRSASDIVFTTIILRSLKNDFVPVNEIYARLFTKPNPPARVTISTHLPPGTNVLVSITVDLGGRSDREGLHVQSRSYWAPANIGPYSQSISKSLASGASLVYVAGQIPLVPETMRPLRAPDQKFSAGRMGEEVADSHHDVCLSLQHLWRIGTCMQVCWWTGAVAFIAASSGAKRKAQLAHQIWVEAHQISLWEGDEEEDDTTDIWDRTFGNSQSLAVDSQESTSLPDFTLLLSRDHHVPGMFSVQVKELPRGCNIEWQSMGVVHGKVGYQVLNMADAAVTVCSVPSADALIAYICIRKLRDHEPSAHLETLIAECTDRVPAMKNSRMSSVTVYSSRIEVLTNFKGQTIPCTAIWGRMNESFVELSAGVVIQQIG